MDEYFINKENDKFCTFCEIQCTDAGQPAILDKLFANERLDKKVNVKYLTIQNSTFASMGFKQSIFNLSDFSFCVFINCYFKRTQFEQVRFLSCTFINCNFDQSIFIRCNFNYAQFVDCFIPYVQMRDNLPQKEENLRWQLCKNLSLQCLHKGNIPEYKRYLFAERKASESNDFLKLFHSASDDYYKKYNFFDGIVGLLNCVRSKISKVLWGYGEKMSSLLLSAFVAILFFSIIFYVLQTQLYIVDNIAMTSWLTCLNFSFYNFFSSTTATHVLFTSSKHELWIIIEQVVGVIAIGFFGAALFRQINRR